MSDCNMYVGLDVHMETIRVARAAAGTAPPEDGGTLPYDEGAFVKFARGEARRWGTVRFGYEAGPSGYGLYRALRSMGLECMVVAPSLIPRKPGVRIKNDRRDALSLARQLRAGELTAVWVPDEMQEAMRDLSRSREDMKAMERQAKQRLCAFLLRHSRQYPGKTKWTRTYFLWVQELKLENPVQQVVLQEYVDTVVKAGDRVKGLEEEMRGALEGWCWAPVVTALMALRGFNLVGAFTLVAEIADFTRFMSATQFMAYLGLMPGEWSSGGSRRLGGITKTGNGHARRILTEAAWTYRFPARKTEVIQRRAEKCSERIQAIAWKAQKRLCRRFRHLILHKNKRSNVAVTAIARELAGFVWAIACEATPPELASVK